jgi:hypothetical protein
MFRHGESARAQWAAKWLHFESTVGQEVRQLRELSTGAGLMDSTRIRLQRLVEGKEKLAGRIGSLLGPFGLSDAVPEQNLPVDRIPSVQHFGSYLDNVFRDWCWGEAEVRDSVQWIDGQLRAAEEADGPDLDGSGRLALVLGGGAGRLTCELAALRSWADVVQLDLNPLLTRVGSLLGRGEAISLIEVPSIAIGLDHVAVEQALSNPGARPGVAPHFVLGDVFAPPFAAGTFDVIVTPWFVDILPEDFRILARRINRLLKTSGTWINFGPLSFESLPPAARYTPEEMAEALGGAGMAVAAAETRRVPYLHSPHGMSRRHEEIFAFRATRKEPAADPGEFRYYPSWMTDPSRPVPSLPIWAQQQHQKIFDVQILGLVDGRRSIDEIVAGLSREYGLPPDRCRAVVNRFFSGVLENNDA